MLTSTLTMDTRVKLNNFGLIPPYSDEGFFQIGILPFQTIFSELPFPKNRIPHYYETKYYLEYLGFTALQSFVLFNDYRVRSPTGLINQFTLLIEAKNHLKNCSDTDVFSRKPAFELGDLSSGEFIWCEKFGLTIDIIPDIDILLGRTRENKTEMDRYLSSFQGAKKVEDLLLIDFLMEAVDRRFTKLITLERDAKVFFEQLP